MDTLIKKMTSRALPSINSANQSS